jgi:hypothetical protein
MNDIKELCGMISPINNIYLCNYFEHEDMAEGLKEVLKDPRYNEVLNQERIKQQLSPGSKPTDEWIAYGMGWARFCFQKNGWGANKDHKTLDILMKREYGESRASFFKQWADNLDCKLDLRYYGSRS